VSLFSGTHLTERNIEVALHQAIKSVVMRLMRNQIDEADATEQLEQLIFRAVNARARTLQRREGE
jgi:hypothetical protein